MIAYIEEKIPYEETEEVLNLFEDFVIFYKDGYILEQKIVLDEFEMNHLFSEVFLDSVDIEYGNYGGEGCDFSIDIKPKKEN